MPDWRGCSLLNDTNTHGHCFHWGRQGWWPIAVLNESEEQGCKMVHFSGSVTEGKTSGDRETPGAGRKVMTICAPWVGSAGPPCMHVGRNSWRCHQSKPLWAQCSLGHLSWPVSMPVKCVHAHRGIPGISSDGGSCSALSMPAVQSQLS